MARKILPIILSFFIIYTPFFAFAATAPGGGGRWTDKTVTRVGLDDIIEATARQQTIRNGSSVTLEAVVRETVKRQAVGKVLLQRILGGGIAIAGITALIEGVGWVMENGQYVKYKDVDPDLPDKEYVWCTYQKCFATSREAFDYWVTKDSGYKEHTIIKTTLENNGFTVWYDIEKKYKTDSSKRTDKVGFNKSKNSKYDPNKDPERQRIVLTDQLTGDLAVGDYTDPVDSSKDKKDRVWTGVESAYQNDPNGIGNDLSDALDDKMDNAPETPSKPSTPPENDGDGQKYPTDKDKGTEGTTDQDKDPETGQPTGSGSFNLPAWCLWAADQCQWHKEDKQHQTEEKMVWEDEKKHRTDEKTFWQTVKDWFSWTKDDSDLPDRDDSDLNTTVDFEEKKIGLNVSPQCPAPTFETITLHGVTAQVKTSDYTYICQLDWLIKPFTIGFASVLACFILFGFNRGSED